MYYVPNRVLDSSTSHPNYLILVNEAIIYLIAQDKGIRIIHNISLPLYFHIQLVSPVGFNL